MPDVQTHRLRIHYLERRPAEDTLDAPRVLLIHGNVSSSLFFKPLLADLPSRWHVLAPDLRGYGDTEPRPVDGARGLADWSADLWSLVDASGWDERPFHLLGWSMGGGIAIRMAIEAAEKVASLAVIAPLPPCGFGGTIDPQGTPAYPDYAGSGGGSVNPAFVQALAAGDRGSETPNSPRSVMLTFYVKAPFRPPAEVEEEWVTAMLSTRTGDDYYPGDSTPSPNWPGTAPGARGIANAMSPKYVDLSALAQVQPKPPILWVRGAHDLIVSDRSMFDMATLGEMGLVPGWPGAETLPPQPMIGQTRTLFDAYATEGGAYREVVFENSGHSPHLEEPEAFRATFVEFVEGVQACRGKA